MENSCLRLQWKSRTKDWYNEFSVRYYVKVSKKLFKGSVILYLLRSSNLLETLKCCFIYNQTKLNFYILFARWVWNLEMQFLCWIKLPVGIFVSHPCNQCMRCKENGNLTDKQPLVVQFIGCVTQDKLQLRQTQPPFLEKKVLTFKNYKKPEVREDCEK